jgi:hypothetical protein
MWADLDPRTSGALGGKLHPVRLTAGLCRWNQSSRAWHNGRSAHDRSNTPWALRLADAGRTLHTGPRERGPFLGPKQAGRPATSEPTPEHVNLGGSGRLWSAPPPCHDSPRQATSRWPGLACVPNGQRPTTGSRRST